MLFSTLLSYNKVWTTAGELTYSVSLCYAALRGCSPKDLINGPVKNLSLRQVRIRINDNCTGRTLHFDKQGNISPRINVLLKSFTDSHFWSRAPVTVPSQSAFVCWWRALEFPHAFLVVVRSYIFYERSAELRQTRPFIGLVYVLKLLLYNANYNNVERIAPL